jgi:membrane associated rhomboid family serine protease
VSEAPDESSEAVRAEERRTRSEEASALAELRAKLYTLTPRTVGMALLIVANIGMFVLMVARGVNPFEPTVKSLIDWGAAYGPKVASGQWWRLLTSMFLHIGILHLVMNMWALVSLGRLVERAQGTVAFITVYVLSGWTGSAVSVAMKPFTVSAGASGAIFGVCGVLVALIAFPRRSLPAQVLRPLRNSTLVILAFNLWFGLTNSHVDLAAHVGGFACGLVCGAILNHELSREARAATRFRTATVAVAGAAVLATATASLQGRTMPDVQAALDQCDTIERQVVATYNGVAVKAQKHEITGEEFARVIERDVLPPWRGVHTRIAALRDVPPEQRPLLRDLARYQVLREEAWELIARGSRADDLAEVKRGNALQREAQSFAARIGKQ